jgi:hypothetical protein
VGRHKMPTNIQQENMKGTDFLIDLDVDERIILKVILKKFRWLRIGSSGKKFVKCRECLDCLSNYQLLKKDIAPWN